MDKRTAAIRGSERYIMTMRRWAPFLMREPNVLLAGSCWYVLTCLPVVTYGPATLALTHYMRGHERGLRVSWRQACALAFRECGAACWLMGLADLLALVMTGGGVLAVLEGGLPVALRGVYALLLITDLVYLLSALYRYPALEREPYARITPLILRGVLMTLGNVGWTLMFSFAGLLALLVCALTGVGVLILYPAAAALLAACAYGEMSKVYTGREEDDTFITR